MPLSLTEKFWRLENDPAWMTIQLPVEPGSAQCEEVLVEVVGENRYRVASSPGIIQGLAADDVIARTVDEPSGYTLLSRGGNLCVHLYCDAGRCDGIQAEVSERLAKLGGWLDGVVRMPQLAGLCYTVPASAGRAVIESEMCAVVGDEWYFSNATPDLTGEAT